MDLQEMQSSMDRLGKTEPLLAMLPASLRGRLSKLDEYFSFGLSETDHLIMYISSLGIKLNHNRALDFGCGLGRSTQALAKYFDQVFGIDIAPSIINIAKAHNRHGSKCQYLLNLTNDLRGFETGSIDYICSMGTLYLMEPAFAKNYLKEFLRVLAPGGALIFQLPAEPATTVKGFAFRIIPPSWVNRYRRAKYGFEVHSMTRFEVVSIVEQAGGTLIDVREDSTVGANWTSFQYCVSK
ncbi:putative Methylase involved in ubiquinone/menaquinonebiosynthesis-like protein [Nitrospira japonica]|uniref:Putative Methylase involved in ubiquinone/menaquinonebiosynthesis-like protein n=1 Tax=Nitrospira japonica TaxID=1325564 RepID=A0A1W1IB16_9BACT|nr:class I SAM-dependent methyltransferase [Nitrospira japonica]SLM49963.1 putative Methylase involved in ubiquinone/menaquinonebiosynthesis-like protein [Nitrospira japonica]